MPGPLDGYRILDLTTTFSGPYCTQFLGDLGADVAKIERPTGDVTRSFGDRRSDRMGSVFLGVNRSKRSVVLDLKDPEDRGRFLGLAGRADVLVHNMRPAAMERLGLGWETLREVRPQLVYCTITGYGTSGRYAGRAAYDDTVQGASGLAWLQGEVNGTAPTYMATAIADKTTGLFAATAILAALTHRERFGEGQHVEVPMFESMTAYALAEQLGGRAYVPPIGQTGYPRMRSPHRRPYATKDGYVCVAVYTDAHWISFLKHVGMLDLLEDERYADTAARSRHVDDLYALVREEMPKRTSAEWLDALLALDIPAGPLTPLDDVFEDPHLSDVGFFQTVTHPTEGPVTMVGQPLRFSLTHVPEPAGLRPAPVLGEHTTEVLDDWGRDR